MGYEAMLGLMALGVAGPIAAWGIWDSWLKHRRKVIELRGTGEVARLSGENEQLSETVQMLEDRMKVLERIATDPAHRTAQQIERLRGNADG